MSDMYLTKVEKKELFFRSLIFILAIFAVSYFSVVGHFVFTLIPWTFFIGIYGRLRYKDPIVTLLVTVITVIYANIANYGFNNASVINIIVAMIGAAVGNIIGKMIFKLKRSHKLELFIKVNVKRTYKITSVICTAIILFIYIYFNGDIVTYTMSRINLHNDIEQEIGENAEYKIVGIKHIAGLSFKYEYEIETYNTRIKALESGGRVWYINSENMSEEVANNLKSKLLEKLSVIKCDFNYTIQLDADSDFTSILPSGIYINITVEDIEEENYEKLALLCNEMYKHIENENIAGIFLNVGEKCAVYSKEDLCLLTNDKILASFEVIELDSLM